jgi:predicted aspartyl protease
MATRWYLTVFCLVAAVRCQAATVNVELPFVLDQQGSVIVMATVGGMGPFRFVLDTGSSHSAIADDLARELALTPIARAEVQTSTGRTMVPVVDVDGVSVAGSSDRLQPSVLARVALQALGPDIRGVLGQDFLSAHNFTIDYARRRFRWDEAGEGLDTSDDPRMVRVPLVEQDGRFVLHAPQGNQDETLRLVADTGSTEIVLFESRRLARLGLTPVSDAPPVALSSLTGSQSVRLMRLHQLALGSLTMRDRLAIVMPPASLEYSSIDGLLPLHTFRVVSFRQRDGYVLIRP